MLLQIDGGVAAARGFRASGIENTALIACDLPAVCAAVYGKNRILSASSKWSSFITGQYDAAQLIAIYGAASGLGTGEAEYPAAVQFAEAAAHAVGIAPECVLVAAAGAAGVPIPTEEIGATMPALVRMLASTAEAGHAAALAISSGAAAELSVEFDIGEKKVRLGGMCRRGEMLAAITTDASISKEMLERALSFDVENTFFMAAPDGMRAGSCVLCLSSGMAGNKRITEEDADYAAFCAAMRHVTSFLARQSASFGRLLEVTVQNAAERAEAAGLARAAAASVPLRKAAGEGLADWGSILLAMGETDVPFDPSLIDISLRSTAGSVQLVRNGQYIAAKGDEKAVFEAPSVTYLVDIKSGNASASALSGFIE